MVASALWSKATLKESWPCAEDKLKRDTCAGDTLRGLLPSGSFCESKASLEKFLLLCVESTPKGIVFLVEVGNKLAPRKINSQLKQGSNLHMGSHYICESSHHAKIVVQSKEY